MATASSKEFLDIQANYRVWIHSETRTSLGILFCLRGMVPPKMCENKKKSIFGRESPQKMEISFMSYKLSDTIVTRKGKIVWKHGPS